MGKYQEKWFLFLHEVSASRYDSVLCMFTKSSFNFSISCVCVNTFPTRVLHLGPPPLPHIPSPRTWIYQPQLSPKFIPLPQCKSCRGTDTGVCITTWSVQMVLTIQVVQSHLFHRTHHQIHYAI